MRPVFQHCIYRANIFRASCLAEIAEVVVGEHPAVTAAEVVLEAVAMEDIVVLDEETQEEVEVDPVEVEVDPVEVEVDPVEAVVDVVGVKSTCQSPLPISSSVTQG